MVIERGEFETHLHTRWFTITISKVRQKKLEMQQAGIWTMKNGQTIHISQMDDGHLMNTIRFIQRRAKKEADATRQRLNPYRFPPPRGEYAQMAYWQGMDEHDALMELAPMVAAARVLKAVPIYQLMLDEVERRGLEMQHVIMV
jgi:hypothetical protein